MGSRLYTSSAQRPFKVLILGGCYAGLSAALNLIDLSEGRAARRGDGEYVPAHDGNIPVDITIVDERDGYYHVIGSPLALADDAYAAKAWVKYDDIPAVQTPKISIIRGTARSVDPQAKSATIVEAAGQTERHLAYDYLVVGTGLRRVWPVVPQSRTRAQYLLEAGAHADRVRNAPAGVVVVGGGAVGIEMATELKAAQPGTRVTLVHSQDRLLSSEALPDGFKDEAARLVREAGVGLLLGRRVAGTREVGREDGGRVTELSFTDGERLDASVVIMAVSRAIPSTDFLPGEALDEENLIRVRPTMQFPAEVPNADDHFGAGDAIRWSGIKRCGAAMHTGYYAAHNIHESILKRLHGVAPKYLELEEVPPMMALAVGKKAISYYPAQGVASGEDQLAAYFQDDIAFDYCWKGLKLGEENVLPKGGAIEA